MLIQNECIVVYWSSCALLYSELTRYFTFINFLMLKLLNFTVAEYNLQLLILGATQVTRMTGSAVLARSGFLAENHGSIATRDEVEEVVANILS